MVTGLSCAWAYSRRQPLSEVLPLPAANVRKGASILRQHKQS